MTRQATQKNDTKSDKRQNDKMKKKTTNYNGLKLNIYLRKQIKSNHYKGILQVKKSKY